MERTTDGGLHEHLPEVDADGAGLDLLQVLAVQVHVRIALVLVRLRELGEALPHRLQRVRAEDAFVVQCQEGLILINRPRDEEPINVGWERECRFNRTCLHHAQLELVIVRRCVLRVGVVSFVYFRGKSVMRLIRLLLLGLGLCT